MPYSILLVEDDIDLQNYLKNELLEKDYSVYSAGTGMSGLKLFEKYHPDIVILDIELPDISGETICKEMKKLYSDIPVIFLTAKNTTPHITHGFEIGADDYVTKPFIMEELLARIATRLKKDNKINETILIVCSVALNKKTFEVTREDKNISLTPKEFHLLEYLMVNKNQIISREQILGSIWQYNTDIESRVVDMYIGMLRKKLDDGFTKKLIQSVRGFGYTFRE